MPDWIKCSASKYKARESHDGMQGDGVVQLFGFEPVVGSAVVIRENVDDF